jgi:Phage P22-like portal protein
MAVRRPTRPRGRARLSPQLTKAQSKADQDLIETARKRFEQARTADTNQRERELQDIQFYDGEQWPADVLLARQGIPGNAINGQQAVPARPSLTIDQTRQPVRSVLNQERQSELGVEIVASDDFGDTISQVSDEEIELREGLVRRIQRDSQAPDARSWAFMRAVIAGRGFYRIVTKYAPRSMDQDIVVERIYNQACVTLDPTHESPDGSDAEWGFVWTDIPWDRYKRDYPKAADGRRNALSGIGNQDWRQLGDELPNWFTGDGDTRAVRVGEYFYVDMQPMTLVQLEDGTTIDQREYDASTHTLALDEEGKDIRRPDTERRVKWVKLDGVQVLDRRDWPGQYIPIVKVVGEELQPYDSERRVEGMIRPARDSQRGFNVMVSKLVEQIGLSPIPPWMMPEGGDEGYEQEYALSTTRTLPSLHFRTTTGGDNPQPLPPPFRTNVSTDIQAIGAAIKTFSDGILSTTSVPDVSLGNIDPALKRAGNAGIQQALTQAKQGTSHFLDNLARSIRYEGMIENDLLYPIYPPGRLAKMISKSGEAVAVPVGQHVVKHPQTKRFVRQLPAVHGTPPQPVTPQTPGAKLYTLTKDASFQVTIKVTKNYETRRQAQETLLSELVQADPQLMTVVGDLLFKYSDGEGHQELEDRMKAVLVPPVQAMLKGSDAVPPQIQAQIAQLTAKLQQATQVIQNKTVEQNAMLAKAKMDNQTKVKVAWIQEVATLSAVDAKVDAENARTTVDAEQEGLMKILDLKFQKFSEAADRLHERSMQHEAHAHDAGMAGVDHAHDMTTTALAGALQPTDADSTGDADQAQNTADTSAAPDAPGGG